MALATPLAALLGLEHPLLQAPMAGGPSRAELVSAVSAAGALGAFGHAYTPPEAMKRDADAVRRATDRPFQINLFAAPQPPALAPEAQAEAIEAITPYFAERGLPVPAPVSPPYAPDLDAQLDAVAAIRPAVLTLHLGELPPARIAQLKSLGIRLGASATNVAEARRAEALGLDFVIAQGGEAGGHRGTYLDDSGGSMTGTLALVRLVARAVRIPVVAAGGIMDGAGIAAALALGAQGAQLGTAFLACPESGASRIHKAELLEQDEDTTVITTSFSGKPARGLANRYTREMAATGIPPLPFPIQNALTGPLRAASARDGDPQFVAMWAGQAAPLARAMPAAELVRTLVAETEAAIAALARLTR